MLKVLLDVITAYPFRVRMHDAAHEDGPLYDSKSNVIYHTTDVNITFA